MSAAAVVQMPIRRARPSDVDNADLSHIARSVYSLRCNHVNADNESWLKKETEAHKLKLSTRSITRARNELVEKGYACFPQGDSGGRARSKESWSQPRGAAPVMRLHPDGCCRCPKAELKQRSAAAAIKTKSVVPEVVKGDKESSFCAPVKGDSESVKGDSESVKGDSESIAYKEGTSSTGTISTPTTPCAPELPSHPEPLRVVALPPEKEKASNQPIPIRTTEPTEENPSEKAALSELAEELRVVCHWPSTLRSDGYQRILAASQRFGFTPSRLREALERQRYRPQTAGGLVDFAEKWPERTEGMSFPEPSPNGRMSALDEAGVIAGRPVGKTALHEFRESGYDLPADPNAVCPLCDGSGYCGSDFCTCDQGRERDQADYQQRIAESARRLAPKTEPAVPPAAETRERASVMPPATLAPILPGADLEAELARPETQKEFRKWVFPGLRYELLNPASRLQILRTCSEFSISLSGLRIELLTHGKGRTLSEVLSFARQRKQELSA